MEAEDKAYSPQDDRKRKMKTPLQLETLEKVFAEEKYPSESIRARLSLQLGLSDRQLKMWFCHRRLKERKSKDDEEPTTVVATVKRSHQNMKSLVPSVSPTSERSSSPVVKEELRWRGSSRSNEKRPLEEHTFNHDSVKKRKKRITDLESVDPRIISGLQAISSVEAQLGEPLREDGPILGVEFDPLPPGGFDSPAVSQQPLKHLVVQESLTYLESKGINRFDLKPQKDLASSLVTQKGNRRRKAPSPEGRQNIHTLPTTRVVQEYQFIPEQPTGREEIRGSSYDRFGQAKVLLGTDNPLQALTSNGSFLQGSDDTVNAYGLPGILSNGIGGILFQLDSHSNNLFPHHNMDLDSLQRNSFSYFSHNNLFGPQKSTYPLLPLGTSFIDPEKQLIAKEHEASQLEKKRKIEEARIAKEVDAYKKRLRRELEQQEITRRKRDEQLQKEKRKEFERLVREKQREDERIQREQRREYERQERLMLKETQRLAREREKEESRRLKEAAKLKAALERATARRLARETAELIDDERLELLEAAAISQGLPSIYLLDGETLQGLDRYKDVLKNFPPTAVKMKPPLAFHPWIESEESVGNLLMVWRFLTTFADVLNLWPFTVDELVQAFHDFESRLLGEIHIALLRTLLRDIEDVARASLSGGGSNQYTAASITGGGHCQLVEAASSWGFDVREWRQHLTPLTWPEILRQFSLAGGYGPLWKRHNAKVVDCNVGEGNDSKEAGKASRSVLATSNTTLKVKGGCIARKSQHQLTPGTVKYAAFHVLSVEGANGLAITDVADRIQRYGLRDLTTSKTPVSSIAAALSRDTYFFERVAPSTYSVKPAFRKDPEDAEKLLMAAAERTRLFQSRLLEEDDGEKYAEDTDEPDMEEDDDDNEVDGNDRIDVQGHLNDRKGGSCHDKDCSRRGMEIDESCAGEPWVQGLIEGEYSNLSVEERLNAMVALIEAVNEGNSIRVALEERMEAAHALKRQMWAEAQLDKRRSKEEQTTKQQFHTGEGVDAEGFKLSPKEGDEKNDELMDMQMGGEDLEKGMASHNLEASNSANMLGFSSEKTRAQTKAEIDLHADELYVYRSLPLGLDRRHNRYWQFVTCNVGEDPGCGRIYFESSEDGHWKMIDTEEDLNNLMAGLDTRGVREAQLHGVLQRLENLFRQGMRRFSSAAMVKKRPSDKRMHCFDEGNGGNQSGCGLHGGGSAVSVVEPHVQVGAIHVQKDSSMQAGNRQHAVECYKELDEWIWSKHTVGNSDIVAVRLSQKRRVPLLASCELCHELYCSQERHCPCCHETFEGVFKSESKFSQHIYDCEEKRRRIGSMLERFQGFCMSVPSKVLLLKAQLIAVEAAIPSEAFKPVWTESQRKAWAMKLKRASVAAGLLQSLTELEGAVQRDWLSPSFETTEELLKFASSSYQLSQSGILPWIPQTTAAVALRLMAFDSGVFYSIEERKQGLKDLGKSHLLSVKLHKVDGKDSSPATSRKDSPSFMGPEQRCGGPGRGTCELPRAGCSSEFSGRIPKLAPELGRHDTGATTQNGRGSKQRSSVNDVKKSVRSWRGHQIERHRQSQTSKDDEYEREKRNEGCEEEQHFVWETRESSDDEEITDKQVNGSDDDEDDTGGVDEEDGNDEELIVEEGNEEELSGELAQAGAVDSEEVLEYSEEEDEDEGATYSRDNGPREGGSSDSYSTDESI